MVDQHPKQRGGGVVTQPVTVGEIVESTVAVVSVEELAVARRYRAHDHEFVVRRLKNRDRDDPLGFGLAEIVPSLAPILYIATDQALRTVIDVSLQGMLKRVGRRAWRLFRRGSRSTETIPALTPPQVDALQKDVERTLVDDGLSPERAREAAEELARQLGLTSQRRPPGLTTPRQSADDDDHGSVD